MKIPFPALATFAALACGRAETQLLDAQPASPTSDFSMPPSMQSPSPPASPADPPGSVPAVPAACDSATAPTGSVAVFRDRDGDGFGDDRLCSTAPRLAPGYVERGGDCDDLDPLRHPERSAPAFATDRCGQGTPVALMDSAEGWTLFASTPAAAGGGTPSVETTGCLGAGITIDYTLPSPTACGPTEAPSSVECSWLVWQRAIGPLDLSAFDYLLFPFSGTPGDPSLQLELKLASDGCLRSYAMTEATDLPVRRTAVVPLAWFSTPVSPGECSVDLANVSGLEIGVAASGAAASDPSRRSGTLHLDAITAVERADVAAPAEHFGCPPADPAMSERIASDLLRRHRESLAERSHPFVASWYGESPAHYYIYSQALVLMVLSLEFERTGAPEYAAAAFAVADRLVSLQAESGDGRWLDMYGDQPGGGLQSGSNSSWVGNVAWAALSLSVFREAVRPEASSSVTRYDASIEAAANWLQAEADRYSLTSGLEGAVTAGTEGNISTAFALLAARRFDRARAIADFLLARVWDQRQQAFWMGLDYPRVALDVIGGWGVDFLNAVGQRERALASSALGAGLFAVRSFDGSRFGLADMGPFQPAFEFSGQYIAAGGLGGQALLDELRNYEHTGALMGSPNNYAGGDGWNTAWEGVAPSAMTYLALRGGVLGRFRLPEFFDGFEVDGCATWQVFDELVVPECYGEGLGAVSVESSLGHQSSGSLSVWANAARSTQSHHLIAGRRMGQAGVAGIWSLEVDARIDPDLASQGETGPEFSLQNTRSAAGAFFTSTAGFQYQANADGPTPSGLAIWAEDSSGNASWVVLQSQRLSAGVWYRLKLVADFDRDRYLELGIDGPDVQLRLDLSELKIARERKFEEQALWVTLESENRWSNCGTAKASTYRVLYDNVLLATR